MKRLMFFALAFAVLVSCKETKPADVEPQYEELDQLAFANLSVINMREDPDYAAELGTQALMGTPLKLHYAPEDDCWVMVETPDGYKAWVNDIAVTVVDSLQMSEWRSSKRVIVTSYYTFFLEEPREDAHHVCDACWGCIAQYVSEAGNFTEVLTPAGKKAFVPTADVTDFEQWASTRKAVVASDASQKAIDDARRQVIETALKFVGIPYLWAGTSIKGVDCSGFSKSVYYLNGYMLLRNANQQWKTGEPVDVSEGLDNLQPADLIFFGREATDDKPARMTHVGIYIGCGKFIHSSGVVRVNSLIEGEPDYYKRKVLRAARIIGNQDCGKDVWSIAQSDFYFEN